MSSTGFDPVRYKQNQKSAYDAVAEGWRKWWTTFEQGAQGLSDHLVNAARIKPGDRVLDIATGIGEPAFTAARRVGPTGRVVAIDQAPQMLAIARRRAQQEGSHQVEVVEMDAESLDFPPGEFNAVLCRWGLMFLPDLTGSLKEMKRVLAPGGRLAAAVWGPADRVPWVTLPMRVARQFVEVPAPDPGAPGPFTLADPDILERAVSDAGFDDVTTEVSSVVLEFPSPSAYTSFVLDISGTIWSILAAQPEEIQQTVRRSIEESAVEFANGEGMVRISNEVVCVVGMKGA